ncbi:nucleotidyltransferase domain-containing protein [Mucilaginibacter auburnensis]|uniref:Nucleotidyltransferase n=1 Tax=Mucilaginibacter auburnensis TaxID=1457233 RepID=A0A2H9VQ98_9SPHI|nr:nucleotidyltransferase domain-containing protein [Mucilaginibacter auburnensis]PJJ80496.1 hypothetical protein CLV57_3647 [Mucilaginibacter auburnensis]
MKEIILNKLLELEQRESIKILYACESGSRAWGFESPDSDFDVRFIYAHNNNKYLSITEPPDVLGLPVNEVLDIGGWDLKKALKLFLKSNGPLYEWLQSPIIYQQDEGFVSEIKKLMPAYYSLRAGANHYLSMAHNTYRDDLQANKVKLKRYFYALRPLLACLWIIEKQNVPPMEFAPLRVLIKDDLIQKTIDDLLIKKSAADEKAYISPVEQLNEWLKVTLEYCRTKVPLLSSNKRGVEELNVLFRKHIAS